MWRYAACGGGAAALHGDHCGVSWFGVSAAEAVLEAVLSTRARHGGSSCDGSRSGLLRKSVISHGVVADGGLLAGKFRLHTSTRSPLRSFNSPMKLERRFWSSVQG